MCSESLWIAVFENGFAAGNVVCMLNDARYHAGSRPIVFCECLFSHALFLSIGYCCHFMSSSELSWQLLHGPLPLKELWWGGKTSLDVEAVTNWKIPTGTISPSVVNTGTGRPQQPSWDNAIVFKRMDICACKDAGAKCWWSSLAIMDYTLVLGYSSSQGQP